MKKDILLPISTFITLDVAKDIRKGLNIPIPLPDPFASTVAIIVSRLANRNEILQKYRLEILGGTYTLLLNKEMKYMISSLITMKALHKLTRFRISDSMSIILFALCGMEIIHKWCYDEKRIHPYTLKFLDTHSGMDKETLLEFREKMQTDSWVNKLHGKKWNTLILETFTKSFKNTTKTYGIILLIVSLIRRRFPKFADMKQLFRTILSIVLIFQSAILGPSIWNICTERKPSLLLVRLWWFISSLNVLIETKERRRVMSLYFLTQMILIYVRKRNIDQILPFYMGLMIKYVKPRVGILEGIFS